MAKRVLILCDKSPLTSFGRIAEAFHRAVRDRYNADLVWLRCPQDFPGNLKPHGLQAWAPSRESGRLLFPYQLAALLKKQKPDWILFIRPELGFLVSTARKHAPQAKLSLMIHDTFAETLYPNSNKFKLINRFWIKGCDNVDGFLFNSRYTQNEAHKVFHIKGPETICDCVVDPIDFYPLREDRLLLRRKWGLSTDKKILLHISLDEPRKNIQTFFALAKRMPEHQFIRIGKFSPWMQEYLQQNGIANVIHHSGIDLPALREFYHMADLFVFPSLLEGFGYPPLESLACGTPVIASNTSAMAEILPGIATLVDQATNVSEWENKARAILSEGKILPPGLVERLRYFGPEAFAERVLQHTDVLGVH